MIHTTPDTVPEHSASEEKERLEAERWFKIFEDPHTELRDLLKADFRLEEVLLLTRYEGVRAHFIERLFNLIEQYRLKEEMSHREELKAIHALLTIGEVLKQGSEETLSTYAVKVYSFTFSSSSVVSGIAHQKFVELLNNAPETAKRTVMARVSNFLETVR